MNFHSSLYLFLFCILFIYCNYISSLFITSLFCFTEILLFFKAFSNFLFAITEHIIHIIKYTIIITILIDNVNIKYDTAKAIIFDIKNCLLIFFSLFNNILVFPNAILDANKAEIIGNNTIYITLTHASSLNII